jgi:hypothetical protein
MFWVTHPAGRRGCDILAICRATTNRLRFSLQWLLKLNRRSGDNTEVTSIFIKGLVVAHNKRDCREKLFLYNPKIQVNQME